MSKKCLELNKNVQCAKIKIVYLRINGNIVVKFYGTFSVDYLATNVNQNSSKKSRGFFLFSL